MKDDCAVIFQNQELRKCLLYESVIYCAEVTALDLPVISPRVLQIYYPIKPQITFLSTAEQGYINYSYH